MLSTYNLQKLADHNFIDHSTLNELVNATRSGSSKYDAISMEVEKIINEINLKELHIPLGIASEQITWIHNGNWSYKDKTFTFSKDPVHKFTLEELISYHKLVCFLSLMDKS